MRVTTILLITAAAVVGAGLFLTRTDRGNELRRNIIDSAGRLRDRFRRQTEDLLEEETTATPRRTKQKADGQLA